MPQCLHVTRLKSVFEIYFLSFSQETFSRSRADDARQRPIPARLEEAYVDPGTAWAGAHGSEVGLAASERRKRPDPDVAHRPLSQTHWQQQKLPLELSNRDYRDESQPTARDQQDPEIWGTATESCDEEEAEDGFGQIERPREEERQGVSLPYAKTDERPMKESGHHKTEGTVTLTAIWSAVIRNGADFMQMNSDTMLPHDLLHLQGLQCQWMHL